MPSSKLATITGGLLNCNNQRLERVGVHRTTCHELRDQRQLTLARVVERNRRIVGDERLDSHPQQLRKILDLRHLLRAPTGHRQCSNAPRDQGAAGLR